MRKRFRASLSLVSWLLPSGQAISFIGPFALLLAGKSQPDEMRVGLRTQT